MHTHPAATTNEPIYLMATFKTLTKLTIAGALLSAATIVIAMPVNLWTQAIRSEDVSALRQLITSGANLEERDAKGRTPLTIAAAQGHTQISTVLLDAGANVNAVNTRGGTPLMYAVVSGNPETARVLLSRGANIDQAGSNGWTALMIAAAKGRREIAQILLDHGSDVNVRDMYGWTPLMRAAYEKRPGVVTILLKHEDVDVNAADDRGETALHHVASKGDAEIAQLLIDHCANIQLKNEQGQTAAMVASDYNHKQLVTLLSANKKDCRSSETDSNKQPSTSIP